MNTSLIRRPAPTEPCGTCGAPVDTNSRYTVRSRFTGKAQCDQHAVADAAEHLTVRTTATAPVGSMHRAYEGTRATFDAGFVPCARCGDTMLETMLSARGKYSGAAVCEPCATGAYRNEVRRPQPVAPGRAWAYAERALEAWRSRTPEEVEEFEALRHGADPYALEWRAQRGEVADIPWEDRHRYDEDDEAEWEARVVGYDELGPYYGPEPGGEALPGRRYAKRWWASGPPSEVRDRVSDADWMLR